jgi:hypothetical protein
MNPRSLLLLFAVLFTALPSAGWAEEAVEEAKDAPVTLEQCRDQLIGDFVVTDNGKEKPLPHVARKLAKSVQETLDDKKNGTARFDRLRREVLERVINGRWTISETSEDILDDCFFAVHPDAEIAE